MQDLPFTLPKYVDNLPPTTFESNARTLKVNQIKDFENVVKESVYFSQNIIKYHSSYYMTRKKLDADPQSEEFCLKFSRKSNTSKPTRKIAISAVFSADKSKLRHSFA